MSHNKFGRRFERHWTKHRAYFEEAARSLLETRSEVFHWGDRILHATIERRFLRRDRWRVTVDGVRVLEGPVGSVDEIAFQLMRMAANIPGVVIPSDDEAAPGLGASSP